MRTAADKLHEGCLQCGHLTCFTRQMANKIELLWLFSEILWLWFFIRFSNKEAECGITYSQIQQQKNNKNSKSILPNRRFIQIIIINNNNWLFRLFVSISTSFGKSNL
jgi:hypothetical protein